MRHDATGRDQPQVAFCGADPGTGAFGMGYIVPDCNGTGEVVANLGALLLAFPEPKPSCIQIFKSKASRFARVSAT